MKASLPETVKNAIEEKATELDTSQQPMHWSKVTVTGAIDKVTDAMECKIMAAVEKATLHLGADATNASANVVDATVSPVPPSGDGTTPKLQIS